MKQQRLLRPRPAAPAARAPPVPPRRAARQPRTSYSSNPRTHTIPLIFRLDNRTASRQTNDWAVTDRRRKARSPLQAGFRYP